jgi:hypothetical protein
VKYLELNELIVGESYICIPYGDNSLKMTFQYRGNGRFYHTLLKEEYTVYGDIRYVISKVNHAS